MCPRAGGVLRHREAYFAIGALTNEEAEGLHNGPPSRLAFARRGRSWPKKSTSAESRFTRDDIALARPSSKEEYERILEWWEGYDSGDGRRLALKGGVQ